MNALVASHGSHSEIGGALVQIGALDRGSLADAHATATSTGRQLEDVLIAAGTVNRADLVEASVKAGFVPVVNRLMDLPEWNVILNDAGQSLGLGATRDKQIAIIANEHDRTRRCFMVLADTAPKAKAQACVAKLVSRGYTLAATLPVKQDLLDVLYSEWDNRAAATTSKRDDESELQKEFDRIALDAYKQNASDIHISTSRGRAAIHLRIHGELEHYMDLTEERAFSLCSAIYNTLAERGSTKEGFNPLNTQDAVIERNFPAGMVRFRYSGLPIAPSGFDVTLRIIPIGVTAKRKTPEQLGYSPDQCDALERIFSNSSGLILFAGTTGSGKSTTMANMLSKVAEERPGKKIRTVEEPVEYRIDGAYQTPVKRIKGDRSDFLNVLRQLMRSDPDLIMVGEIRDGDTAELAIQAVRSGHLCVSTIHADGAPICYDRLVGMGMNRQDLASVGLVAGLIYQKLVQVLCPHCKVPASHVELTAGDRTRRVLDRVIKVVGGLEGIFFRNESGCQRCAGRGVIGRTVCAEIFRPTPSMLDAVGSADSTQLWREWRRTIGENELDMTGRTAFEHAIAKMKEGIVSPDSVEAEFRFLDERPYEGIA